MNGVFQWIAGGAVGLIATVALAFSTSTTGQIGDIQQKLGVHENEISLLKQSDCINNQNLVNIGKKLGVPVVTDGSCTAGMTP